MTAAVGRLDIRLALPAGGAWLGAALLVTRSVASAIGVAVASAIACVVLSVVGWRAAAAVLLGAVAGAAATALHVTAVRAGPVADAAAHHEVAEVTARLVRDPTAVRSRHGRRLVVADATVTRLHVDAGGRRDWRTSAPVVVFSADPSWLGLLPGQRVTARGRLASAGPGDNVTAVFFATGPPRLVGRPPPWQRAAGRVRAALRRACAVLPADERGLVPGLVLGDVSAMPPSLTTAFRTTGLTHLNAVSGENVAIVIGTVVALIRRLGLARRLRALVAAAALGGFVVLVRPSPSVLRAAVMGAVVLAAVFAGRRTRPLPALAAAVLLLVLADPFLARAPGFALSVLATLAIVTLAPAWSSRLSRWMPRPIAVAIAVPAAAQLACTPVIVAVFGQLTPLAVPANLLAAPAVPAATLAGIAAALVAVVATPPAGVLAWVAAVPAAWLAGVARGIARLPGAGLTWPRGGGGLLLLGAALAGVLVVLRATKRVRARGMLALWPP